jgi:hypothetical protein
MGKRTGNPRGRPKGAKTKTLAVIEERIEQAEQAAEVIFGEIPEHLRFKGNAHAALISLYQDMRLPPQVRLAAASKAVHFEKPTLAAVSVQNSGQRSEAEEARRKELLSGFQKMVDVWNKRAESAKVVEGERIS